jgi:hypothetical protein
MTTRELTEDQQRIRAYIYAQSEKYSWFELLPRVMQTRIQLLQAIEGVTDEQANIRPDSDVDEWTIREAMDHAVRVAQDSMRNIERLALGESDSRVYEEPPRPADPRPLTELRALLLENTLDLVALPARMPVDPPLEPKIVHVMFGDLHCKGWFIFLRVHEVDHVSQVTKIREAIGI